MKRLRDQLGGDPRVERAGALLRQVATPPALTPAQLARIHLRLGAPRPRSWRLATATSFLALAAVVVALRRPTPPPVAPLAPPTPAPVRAGPPEPSANVRYAAPLRLLTPPPPRSPRLPVELLSLSGLRVAGSASGLQPDCSERLLLLPAPRPARSVDGALARESVLLARALRALESDPAAALRHLETYGAVHPHGRLRDEARLVRLDALLRLGRRADALRLLEGLPLLTGPRAAELRQLRAALRSERFFDDASRERLKEDNTP